MCMSTKEAHGIAGCERVFPVPAERVQRVALLDLARGWKALDLLHSRPRNRTLSTTPSPRKVIQKFEHYGTYGCTKALVSTSAADDFPDSKVFLSYYLMHWNAKPTVD
ncbi:hypothetical protein pipiens_011804 [Culex pipiens pipiens]|uniref:Uncharacterized protein n=1 Tax=Culex pipiens pipiens TaxID=38569 RepID=A0ABD1D193_CULPP